MVNFGAPDTVPEKYRGRLFYEHNPQVTLMRTTAEENAAMATVGGNLFAASPYGDFTAALLVLDAEVNPAQSMQGRGIPLQDFLGIRDREPRALVASVTITRPRDVNAFRFTKVTRVKPKGVSVLSIAANLPQSGGRIGGARVAFGAMGPMPARTTISR